MSIPKKSNKYYVNIKTTLNGNTLEAGKIYEIDPQYIENIQGNVESVDFVALDKIEAEAKSAVEQFKKKAASIETSPLYKDTEAKAYLIDEARAELDEKINELKQKHSQELQTLKDYYTEQTMQKPSATPQELEAVEDVIEATETRLMMATYDTQKLDALRLLESQTEVMSEGQQAALANKLGRVAGKVTDSSDREIKETLSLIYVKASQGNVKQAEAEKKLKHLAALEGYNLTLSYTTLRLTHRAYRGRKQ